MYFYDIVPILTSRIGLSIENLSLKMGKTANYIYSQKSRGSSPKVDTAAALVSACGHKLCAIPKGEVPDSALVISKTGEEER